MVEIEKRYQGNRLWSDMEAVFFWQKKMGNNTFISVCGIEGNPLINSIVGRFISRFKSRIQVCLISL
jgi:hypothetical protein